MTKKELKQLHKQIKGAMSAVAQEIESTPSYAQMLVQPLDALVNLEWRIADRIDDLS